MALGTGVGSLAFLPGVGPWPHRPITVWYAVPDGDLSDAPILIVIPGRRRNGAQYRDTWLSEVVGRRVVLVVPELPVEPYTMAHYNLGNLVDGNGSPVPEHQWTLSVVESLFDLIRTETGSRQPGYHLYGHSAGAQFVHRLLLFARQCSVVRAVAANAGWYTMPDPTVDFPYGLARGPVTIDEEAVARIVASPLAVLLGSEDDDPDAGGLRRDPGARSQGRTRLDRGFAFYDQGARLATSHGLSLRWEVLVVDGAEHSNAAMVSAAASVLFGPEPAPEPGPDRGP